MNKMVYLLVASILGCGFLPLQSMEMNFENNNARETILAVQSDSFGDLTPSSSEISELIANEIARQTLEKERCERQLRVASEKSVVESRIQLERMLRLNKELRIVSTESESLADRAQQTNRAQAEFLTALENTVENLYLMSLSESEQLAGKLLVARNELQRLRKQRAEHDSLVSALTSKNALLLQENEKMKIVEKAMLQRQREDREKIEELLKEKKNSEREFQNNRKGEQSKAIKQQELLKEENERLANQLKVSQSGIDFLEERALDSTEVKKSQTSVKSFTGASYKDILLKQPSKTDKKASEEREVESDDESWLQALGETDEQWKIDSHAKDVSDLQKMVEPSKVPVQPKTAAAAQPQVAVAPASSRVPGQAVPAKVGTQASVALPPQTKMAAKAVVVPNPVQPVKDVVQPNVTVPPKVAEKKGWFW